VNQTGMTLSSALKRAIHSVLEDVHVCLPGRIETYDHETQLADVKPLLKRKFKDGSESLEFPVCTSVPVVMPRTSSASLILPVKKGDYVMLLFSERAIGDWLQRGGIIEQQSERVFDLSDAIAIPGLYPSTVASPAPNANDLQIQNGDSKITIKAGGDIEVESNGAVNIKSGEINLGDGVMHQKLATEDFVNLVFKMHVHPTAPVGPVSPPTPIPMPTELTSKVSAE